MVVAGLVESYCLDVTFLYLFFAEASYRRCTGLLRNKFVDEAQCKKVRKWMLFNLINFISRYWHRSLNPRKLVEVKFSHLSRNMTLQRTMKLYRLPDVSSMT